MLIKILDKDSLGQDLPFEILQKFGEVVAYDYTAEDEVFERISDADIIIINKIKIGEAQLLRAKRLKLVCIFATGFDNVDLSAAVKYGVGVCNVPAYSTESVALFTATNVLALYSKLSEYRRYVASGEYSRSGKPNAITPIYHEMKGKIWGIVGLGNIGKRVADIARALGAEVIVNKQTPVEDYKCVDIDTLCKTSDIITVHCPLTDKTRGLIGKERLAMMKKDAILVNEARGAVVDEEAVAEAVLNGEIGAFGSDVYSKEPFPENHPYTKIMNLDNVCLTPHAAWGAYEARNRCLNIICENIESYLNGGVQNRVDLK